MNKASRKDPFNAADTRTVEGLKAMIASTRYGALASIEPGTGHPVATRVGLATDADGNPLIFVSALAAHTPALIADPRCSLLIGAVGRGDPLAHKRATLFCRATEVGRDSPAFEGLLARYVAAQPKAKLYAGLADFRFFVLEIERAVFNGGFGRAYRIEGALLRDR
jgi:hypothetical protein